MAAWPWLPGSHTTPASAAASAARCIRRLLVQYQATSTTTAHSAIRAIIEPAKITRIWPASRPRRRGRRDAAAGRAGVVGSSVVGCITGFSVGGVEGHDRLVA